MANVEYIADSKRFGIGAMSGISGAARAVRMALEAGKWLVAYADNLMRVDSVEPKPAMATREEVNAELRGWYAKALAPMESLVREAESFEPEAD